MKVWEFVVKINMITLTQQRADNLELMIQDADGEYVTVKDIVLLPGGRVALVKK